jgi:chemotaxis protein methyltransferase CheR
MTLSDIALRLKEGADRNLILQIMAAASTNHTAFFRENIWDYFKANILSDFLKKEPQIRIWSAAASSGEEAYTIAMCAAEITGLQNIAGKIAILGTDINFRVLKQAEDGIYACDALNGLPAYIVNKYFRPLKNQYLANKKCYEICNELKKICLFRRLNLKKRPWPFKKKFHVIFCRNVLYYFDKKEREEIVNALYRQVETGGYLVVSVTESLAQMNTSWQRTSQTGIYRKG